jgi:hypothetical protein
VHVRRATLAGLAPAQELKVTFLGTGSATENGPLWPEYSGGSREFDCG